jgi:triacylglycerol lipase
MNFEPGTTRFSATNAEALAVAATIAYEADNTKAQRRAEKELGLDQFFEPFEHHNFVIDTEGFVAASKQHVILAFRGTEPGKIKDWATDALAAPSAFRWFFELAPDVGNVHSGFANSLRDSWAESIRKLLKKAGAGTRRTLWITGHSLGGALAVLAGGACTYDPGTLLPVNGLYTFGQPRTISATISNSNSDASTTASSTIATWSRACRRGLSITRTSVVSFISTPMASPTPTVRSNAVFWRAPLARSARC